MTNNEKVKALYGFLREFTKLRSKTVTNYKNQEWYKFVEDIHSDYPDIELFYRDKTEEEVDEDDDLTILKIHRPVFTQRCPSIALDIKEWVQPGWDDFRKEIQIIDKRLISPEDSKEEEYEFFNDNPGRVEALKKWEIDRNRWATEQKKIQYTRDLFMELYQCYIDLERESETLEMVVCCGLLRDKNDASILHPILAKRVNIFYNAKEDTIRVMDTEVQSELYSGVLQSLQNAQVDCIKELSQELSENDYHPLDRNDAPEFLKVLIRRLSVQGVYVDSASDRETPDGRFFLSFSPMFLVRKRIDGAIKAIEAIVDDVETADDIPTHLAELVSGGSISIPDDKEETIEELLAAVGGEDTDILLSKEANREQLEIARRVEQYNAVLVQGPPGTGKTHTIANLMGHFLSQGKSVLVTSHTKKALSVVKDKVSDGIKSLCVSVLDDSNEDMEKSIDGITDAMGRMTSMGLKREIESVKLEREDIIKQLAVCRKKLYTIINKECQNIVFNGEEISPTNAAKYVFENEEKLSYIPGKVELYSALPLSMEELYELYESNAKVSEKDEKNINIGFPRPEELISVDAAAELFKAYENCSSRVKDILKHKAWNVDEKKEGYKYYISDDLCIKKPNLEELYDLYAQLKDFTNIEEWMKGVIIDGRRGGAFSKRWIALKEKVDACCTAGDLYIERSLGKEIYIPNNIYQEGIVEDIDRIIEIFDKKGKIGKFDIFFKPSVGEVLDAVRINGKKITCREDALCIRQYCVVWDLRYETANIWNQLFQPYQVDDFMDLDYENPELYAKKKIKCVDELLAWSIDRFGVVDEKAKSVGIDIRKIAGVKDDDTDIEALDKILNALNSTIPAFVNLVISCEKIKEYEEQIEKISSALSINGRDQIEVCSQLNQALLAHDFPTYKFRFDEYIHQFGKTNSLIKRNEYIKKLSLVAPGWAEAIVNREGVHGSSIIPEDIVGAWKWKQYSGIIDELTSESYKDLQKKSLRLSEDYRRVTCKYAEKLAWYHLLKNTEADIDMKQALQGWKQTVKKIGKGTGKNAPMYRRQARGLMSKCQKAVPAWIMPINKALETLNPGTNKFDVVIVDEASQSDISALAIVYMAKKLIIVGDDKQVSPMAVGIDMDALNALSKMYLEGIIPNSHLYTAKTSLYDIAATTFQPLMLREHFRCVPEIIGFSNSLSYDFKIKPLRDESESVILPAVTQYRVIDGRRDAHQKLNREEGLSIIALIKSCLEQPEYAGKTFGIIGMLGDEQPKYIRGLISKYIDPVEVESRRILCGNPAHFQGDERDIIFLSLVDSNESDGPLRIESSGVEDATKKRYNVAASRARDQLWVVNSLDSDNDLKEGDLRKRLIEYAKNPETFAEKLNIIEKFSESPFEESVAKYLVSRGYDIVQQWKVGAYRLDIVVVYNNLKVVIECDGEKYHSSDEQIRSDMERQTILERCGWKFIRIRGSEYFRNPESTMENVIEELNSRGIFPQSAVDKTDITRDTELLQRVKTRAEEILNELHEKENKGIDFISIEMALNPKKIVNNSMNETTIEPKKTELVQAVSSVSEPIQQNVEDDDSRVIAFEQARLESQIKLSQDNEEKRHKMPGVAEVYKRISDTTESMGRGIVLKIAYELNTCGLKFVDRSALKILWVIYEPQKENAAEEIFEKYNCKYSLEERGAVATGGVKAWRVILPE